VVLVHDGRVQTRSELDLFVQVIVMVVVLISIVVVVTVMVAAEETVVVALVESCKVGVVLGS